MFLQMQMAVEMNQWKSIGWSTQNGDLEGAEGMLSDQGQLNGQSTQDSASSGKTSRDNRA
jgi:hypothetical protein